MILASKFKANPSWSQKQQLRDQMDIHANIYNRTLDTLEEESEWISKYDMFTRLTQWKKKDSNSFDAVNSKAAQQTVGRVYNAIDGLQTKKEKGYSVGKLRHRNTFTSIEYNQSGFTVSEETLRLHPVGHIPWNKHRDISGSIKGVTIKVSNEGDWYASVLHEVETKDEIPLEDIEDEDVDGIHFNVSHLITDSDGRIFESLWSALDSEIERVKREQQKLSRKEYGSNNYKKQKANVQKSYTKLVNKRNDILHKLTNWYVERYDYIAVEDIESEKLSQGLVSHIKEQAWGRFKEYIAYKASQAGVHIAEVDPAYTSQDCSQCGNRRQKDLSERQHNCQNCGLSTHRDINAAINIEDRGRELGQGLSETTPWEMRSADETHVSLRTIVERGSPGL